MLMDSFFEKGYAVCGARHLGSSLSGLSTVCQGPNFSTVLFSWRANDASNAMFCTSIYARTLYSTTLAGFIRPSLGGP